MLFDHRLGQTVAIISFQYQSVYLSATYLWLIYNYSECKKV